MESEDGREESGRESGKMGRLEEREGWKNGRDGRMEG